MGKIERILARLDEQDPRAPVIELNEGRPESIIHIQTNTWRLELSLNEYRELAASVLTAELRLRCNKDCS